MIYHNHAMESSSNYNRVVPCSHVPVLKEYVLAFSSFWQGHGRTVYVADLVKRTKHRTAGVILVMQVRVTAFGDCKTCDTIKGSSGGPSPGSRTSVRFPQWCYTLCSRKIVSKGTSIVETLQTWVQKLKVERRGEYSFGRHIVSRTIHSLAPAPFS